MAAGATHQPDRSSCSRLSTGRRENSNASMRRSSSIVKARSLPFAERSTSSPILGGERLPHTHHRPPRAVLYPAPIPNGGHEVALVGAHGTYTHSTCRVAKKEDDARPWHLDCTLRGQFHEGTTWTMRQ